MRSRTSAKSIERQKQISQFLAARLRGQSFREIGEAQTPSISPQAVHKAVSAAIRDIVAEPVEQIRAMEALRLEELQNALWPQALAGDIAVVDRVIQIMKRRAALMGLDRQPSGWFRDGDETDPQRIMVEIVGDPEIERLRWLEAERRRLLEAGVTADKGIARSVN